MGQEFDCDYIEKAGKTGMTDELIVKLFEEKSIGNVVVPIVPVSGGFMHRMYRVETDKGMYAVKHLNPGIMKRPDALNNYRRAEALEKQLEDAGIPIVPAITIDGNKMQLNLKEWFDEGKKNYA